MNFDNKFKIIILCIYSIISLFAISIFFYFFDLKDISNYEFLVNLKNDIIQYKNLNILFFNLIYIIFCILWLFLIGIGIPLAILTGMIYGKLVGTFLFLIILATSSTLFYLLAKFFFSKFIKKKLSNKYLVLKEKFKKNEFVYFLIFKFIEDIPFPIANSIPVLFDVKVRNVFICTFIGLAPSVTSLIYFGSSINQLVDNSENIRNFLTIFSIPGIYLPVLFLLIISFVGFKMRKFLKLKD